MNIRKAERKDLHDIAKIFTDNWKSTYKGLLDDAFLSSMNYESSYEQWGNYMEFETSALFVGEENNKILGFSACNISDEADNAYILDALHLVEDARGKGLGKKLLYACGNYSYTNGYQTMFIAIVTGNKPAEDIYTHLGAKYFKDYTEYFGENPSDSRMFVWNDTSIFKDFTF